MDLGLKGKVIPVGGGAGGVGKAVCAFLESEGAIPIAWDIKTGTDLSDPKEVDEAFGHVLKVYGRIDGYVSSVYGCAPGGFSRPLLATVQEMRIAYDYTFLAAMLPTQKAANILIEQGDGGALVILATINGTHRVALKESGYDEAKAGLIQWGQNVAVTALDYGVHTVIYSMGTIKETDPWVGHDDLLALVESQIPGKKAATPRDIAPIVGIFLSPFGRMFNGHIVADLGWHLTHDFDKNKA